MTDDERALWLAGLKPGDEVVTRWGSGHEEIKTIAYVTTKRLNVDGDSFDVKTGQLTKNSFRTSLPITGEILPVTQELRDRLEWCQLHSTVYDRLNRGGSTVSLDQLRRIAAILDEPATEDADNAR